MKSEQELRKELTGFARQVDFEMVVDWDKMSAHVYSALAAARKEALNQVIGICERAADGTVESMSQEGRSDTWKIIAQQSVEQYHSIAESVRTLRDFQGEDAAEKKCDHSATLANPPKTPDALTGPDVPAPGQADYIASSAPKGPLGYCWRSGTEHSGRHIKLTNCKEWENENSGPARAASASQTVEHKWYPVLFNPVPEFSLGVCTCDMRANPMSLAQHAEHVASVTKGRRQAEL
jgi:hypothetical protein